MSIEKKVFFAKNKAHFLGKYTAKSHKKKREAGLIPHLSKLRIKWPEDAENKGRKRETKS